MAPISGPHFMFFPFMSKGHTLPLLYLGRLLRRRSIAVTIVTTAGNSPSIRNFLRGTDINIVELPFPQEIDGVPPGVESTDKLPSMACFVRFACATKNMQHDFEKAIRNLLPISCLISDTFLGWTQESAANFGIPRLAFSGMGIFSTSICQIMGRDAPHAGTVSPDSPFLIQDFPKLKLTRNDFEPPFSDIQPAGEWVDFMAEQILAQNRSHGLIINSFYELESSYVDYWNQKMGPKAWCIGPLCLAKPPSETTVEKPLYVKWLDGKSAEGKPVLYVSFGTQAEVSEQQLHEIATGLEKSQVSFLWVVRLKSNGPEKYLQGFENRVKSRGLIVKEWVDQMKILQHEAVKGFLSHCGWNSVMESLSSNVPILAFPLMAEQHLNTRFVAEEIGVGLRIMSSNGSVRGFVEAGEVEKKVKEFMEGEKGKAARKKAAETGEAACTATRDGGSSWQTLNFLIRDVCGQRFSRSYFHSTTTEEFLRCREGQDLLFCT